MATLAPDHILKDLANLWVTLGKEGQAADGAGVLRACSLTLIVLAEASDDLNALGETLAALMPEHPARSILIRLSGAGERTLAGRVYAQCWMPFGQRRQICCEQIEITASDAALGELAPVVLPLTASDVPVVLWCRSARLTQLPEFAGIASMASKVIVDSAGFPDCSAALKWLADSAHAGMLVSDLAWTRITRWREMLAQVFENRQNLGRLSGISSVRVTFGGRYENLARYFGAWVFNALEDAGVHAPLQLTHTGDESAIALELAGDDIRVSLKREDERLIVAVDDLSHCTNLPKPGEYILMREELGILRRDPVFERTLASAVAEAYSTDK